MLWIEFVGSILDQASGKRCLVKAGSNPYQQEPLNEVFSGMLHERLGFQNYVPYTLLWEHNMPYSVCENFITIETELVSGVSINKSMKRRSHNSSYEHFLESCEQLSIPGMQEFIDYMIVFDFLIANTDRHFGNLGAVRNVETLEWIGPAPIFDSGTSLWHDTLNKVIQPFGETEAKPFYKKASKQMELVTDFEWISFEKLTGITDELEKIFSQSEFMDQQRIDKISMAMAGRIEELKEMAREHK